MKTYRKHCIYLLNFMKCHTSRQKKITPKDSHLLPFEKGTIASTENGNAISFLLCENVHLL